MSGADLSRDVRCSRNGRVDKYLDLSLPGMKLLDVSTRGGKSQAPIEMCVTSAVGGLGVNPLF